MQNEFELKRRAMSAYWQSITEGGYRPAYEPSFNESFVDVDPANERVYVALRDQHSNILKCYRYNANKQLKALTRIPKFMRTTGQVIPFN